MPRTTLQYPIQIQCPNNINKKNSTPARNRRSAEKTDKRSRSRDKKKKERSHSRSSNGIDSLSPRQGLQLHSFRHCFYYMNQFTSVGLSFAVWNLCIKLVPRPQPVLILCDSTSQLASIRRVYKLHRKICVLDEKQSTPKLKDLMESQKPEVVITTQKKMSIIMAIQDESKLFGGIISTSKCIEADFYVRLVETLKQKATIIIFPESSSVVARLMKQLGIQLVQVDAQLSKAEIQNQMMADIRLAPEPTTEGLKQLKQIMQLSSLTAQSVAARLLELEKQRRKPSKSLYLQISGYVTYQLDLDVEFNSLKYVWNFLREEFPKALTEQIRNMQKLSTEKGVVFNIPEDLTYLAEVTSQKLRRHKSKFKGIFLKECTTLPALEDTESEQYKLIREKKKLAMENKRQLQIFIGGIPYEMDEEALKAYFRQHFINIFLVRILKDEKGFSKGIGFALCENKEHFDLAIKLSGSRLMDRTIRVKLADQRN